MEKKFLPGDIVRYGFGTEKNGEYECSNTVCVIEHKLYDVYKCLFVCGDYWFESIMEIKMVYDDETNKLFHSFHPELHSREIVDACN